VLSLRGNKKGQKGSSIHAVEGKKPVGKRRKRIGNLKRKKKRHSTRWKRCDFEEEAQLEGHPRPLLRTRGPLSKKCAQD